MFFALSHKRDSGGTKEQWQGLWYSEHCFKTTMSQIFVFLTRPHFCNFCSPDSTWLCTNPEAFLERQVLQPPPEGSCSQAPPLSEGAYTTNSVWVGSDFVMSFKLLQQAVALELTCICSQHAPQHECQGHSCACLLCYHDFPVYNYPREDDESWTHFYVHL